MSRNRLLPAVLVATALGIGLLVLQRWVAETRFGAIALVSIWFAVVGAAALIAVRRRPELRMPVLGTYAAIAIASAAVGYWTGFRDTEVDEEVVVATAAASPGEQAAGLAGSAPGNDAEPAVQTEEPNPKPANPGPVELAQGEFRGEDGHDGSGIATVVREPNGDRMLTFTEFDVDPGAKVVVWLTRDESSFDDRVELGSLKGNVGDQQYEIPAGADLRRYDTVVLYCTPFTVRIAVAPLG